MIRPGLESARQFAGKAAYSEQGGLTRHKTNRLGDTMIQSKLAALALIAGPAQAGTCVPVDREGADLALCHYAGVGQGHAARCRHRRQDQEQLEQLSKGMARRLCRHDVGGCLPMKLDWRLPEGGDAMVTCTKLGLWPIRTNQFHGHVIRGFRDT